MGPEEEAVVVPLVPVSEDASTETLLRMLLNREAVLISRHTPVSNVEHSGMVAQASGAFAKAIGGAIDRISSAPTGGDLYRVVLPTGSVARDLVAAVGGGFRGMVRTAGSPKISGQVRLVPAAAGAGATIAAGPLIATVGLAVAGEMLAQHQTNKKLDSIRNAVASLQQRFEDEDRSVVRTADLQANKVAGYLLDQAHLPTISSASHAFGELDQLTNSYIERMNRWLGTVERYGDSDRVYGPQLMRDLVGKHDDPVQAFESAVVRTYETLALRARVVVLEKVAAEFSNPDRSLPHIEGVLRAELLRLATRQSQLVALLSDLSAMQIDSSKVPVVHVAGKKTLTLRTSFGRLARALHEAPDGIPVLTDAGQTVLELAPNNQGLAVVAPTASS